MIYRQSASMSLSWNTFNLGFSKLSPDFSSMFVQIGEFQSKYHRENQISAQIWQSSENYSNCRFLTSWIFLFLPKSVFCKKVGSSSFWASHPSRWEWCSITVSWFHLPGFFPDFLQPRAKKPERIRVHFTFLLILPSRGSSQMQIQVCISSNKTIEALPKCFNFHKIYRFKRFPA